MYESYFGFSEKPFSILPDANFLYLSKKHKLALTVLRYGLESHALITVITGDIGCGKTTLLRKLIGEVSDDVTIGLITNTHSAFGDPLKLALQAFDLTHRGKSKTEQYQTLVDFIINEYAQNQHTVLIVDEAQNLDNSALEELRMLSNINVDQHHVLQLVLVGQPELRQALKRPELRQFAQRVSADYHILPLEPEEIAAYIQHRLIVVGGDPKTFLPETYPLIHAHTNGVPRLINIVCDTAFLHAYGEKKKTINAKLMQEVIADREAGVYFNNTKVNPDHNTSTQTPAYLRGESLDESRGKQADSSDDKPAMEKAYESRKDLISDPEWLRTASERIGKGTPKSVAHAGEIEHLSDEIVVQEEGIAGEESKEPIDPISSPGKNASVSKNILDNKDVQSATVIQDPSKSWFGKAVMAASLLVLSIGLITYYQNPGLISGLLLQAGNQQEQEQEQEHTLAQTQDWTVEVDKYMDAKQWVTPVGSNAYETLQKVLESEPDNKRAQSGIAAIKDKLFAQALSTQNQGEGGLARSQLQALLQINPQSERAQKALDALDLAQETERAQAQEQTQIQSWLLEADRYSQVDQLTEPVKNNAYEMLAKVLEIEPDNVKAKLGIEAIKDTLFSSATTAQTAGNWVLARSQLLALLQIEPQSKRGQEALNTLEVAVEAERTLAAAREQVQAWLVDADKYLQAGHLVEPTGKNAYEALYKVFELEPDNARARAGILAIKDQLYAKAQAAQTDANWDMARNQLQALLQIEPQSERGWQALEALAVAQEAERELVAARERINEWLGEANAYLQKNQLVEPAGANAYDMFNKVLVRETDNAKALAGLSTIKDTLFSNATTAHDQADWALAREQLQALLQIEPQSERGQQALEALTITQQAAQAQVAAQAQIQEWLLKADQYLQAKQWIEPAGENAYEFISKVLEREADNSQALAGLVTIKDTLYSNATAAHDQADWGLARTQLQALLQIEPQSERGQQALEALTIAQQAAQAQVAAQAQTQEWLSKADEYLQSKQLIEPAGENAYEFISKVLEREQDNSQALAGLVTIKDTLYSNATAAHDQADWGLARTRLQALLQIEPQSERGQQALEALTIAQQAAQAQVAAQAQTQEWLSKAGEYLQSKQWIEPAGENAYEFISKVLEREQDNSQALAGLVTIKDALYSNATAAHDQADWGLARTQLQALLQIEPQSERGQQALEALTIAQQAAQAQVAAQAQTQEWLSKAAEYLQSKQWIEPAGENAYEFISRVLEREPDNSQALAGLVTIKDTLYSNATAAQNQADWDTAHKQLQALLQIEPQSERGQAALVALINAQQEASMHMAAQSQIQGWLAQGENYMQAEKLHTPVSANAYEVFNKVLEREPDNGQALAGIALIKDKLYASAMTAKAQGDLSLTRSRLWALLQIDPQSDRGRKALAVLTDAKKIAEKPAPAKVPTPQQPDVDQDLLDFLRQGGEGEELPAQAN